MTGCITVLVVAVVLLISVSFIRSKEHHQSRQLLLLMCETGEKNLDYYFSSVEQSVKNVASFAERELVGLADEDLHEATEKTRTYFEQVANKTNGVLTYYFRIDPTVTKAVEGFWYTNLDGRGFVEHAVTDITQYDTADTSSLVWFTVPKSTGKPIWQSPYITDNLNVRVVSYNYPLYWRKQFVGVVGIELDYSMMAEQVESIRLFNNGYAFLTDAGGSLIYHPRIDLATVPDDQWPQKPDGLFSEQTFTEYTFEGREREAAWQRLNNGMRLYVTVPVEETEGDWHELIRNVMIASAGVLILAGIVAMLISSRITRPLQQLTEAAKQADQGNYDLKLDYKSNDEVGVLTQTFSNMAVHVKEHISSLNKRVYVDALTSVRNKGAYESYIEKMQDQLADAPKDMEFAVGIFDCDCLKSINDKHGHDKGDIYLQSASRLICRIFQHSPVFRIGGDEFAAILLNDDYRNRADLVDRFEKEVLRINGEKTNPWEQVHVSMGIAVYDPEEDLCVNDTIRRADKKMYVNKRNHRINNIV